MKSYFAYKRENGFLPTDDGFINQSAQWHSAVTLLLGAESILEVQKEETKKRLADLKRG